MAGVLRVTVTLPADVVRDMDRREKNRSQFVADAVRHELEHRRSDDFRLSLLNPHSESALLAGQGVADWAGSLPVEDAGGMVDGNAGTAVRWVPGEGWVED
jgi:hypothetical protein